MNKSRCYENFYSNASSRAHTVLRVF